MYFLVGLSLSPLPRSYVRVGSLYSVRQYRYIGDRFSQVAHRQQENTCVSGAVQAEPFWAPKLKIYGSNLARKAGSTPITCRERGTGQVSAESEEWREEVRQG